jgi:type I restriction-modification system DNA methylase subunit
MDTGIAEIDAIETDNSLDQLAFQLSLEDGTGALLTETGDYIIQEAYVVDTVDENAMNDFFDKQDDTILDFTESNPFGDVGKVG